MTQGYRFALRTAACTLSLLLLNACSTLGARPAQGQPETHADTFDQRIYQDDISLSGKISVRYEKKGKPEQLPGSFDWDQHGTTLHITLFSPLGQTVARITQEGQRAMLEQDGQAPRYAQDLDELLQDRLGWALPVAGLRDWLQGFIRQADGTRRGLPRIDQQIENDGWLLRYASWQQDVNLPKRIELNRDTSQAGHVSISIFIQPPGN